MLGLLAWSWGSEAQAQQEADVPDPELAGAQADQVEEEARALFQAGRIAYDAGRYEEALERFRAAHELTDLPALLYNVALAADRARYDEEALEAYERFLAEAEPDGATEQRVEARVAGLRRALERRSHSESGDTEGPAQPPTDVPTPAQAARDTEASEPSTTPPAPPQTAAEEETDGGLSAWAWVGIGGGVLAAGAAVLAAVLLTRDQSSVTPGDHGVVVTTLGAR